MISIYTKTDKETKGYPQHIFLQGTKPLSPKFTPKILKKLFIWVENQVKKTDCFVMFQMLFVQLIKI